MKANGVTMDRMDNDTLIRLLRQVGIYDRIMADIDQIEKDNYRSIR